jgi:2-C-methyl-D-erythritol 4-phosphate cytidylyltransferase
MNVRAVVVAGGRPGGTDTLTAVAGVPMLVRAVRSLLDSGLVDHVVVLDAEARWDAVLHACAGLPVSAHDGLRGALFPFRTHAGQRADTTAGDGRTTGGSADVVVVHDAARPLAPVALAVAVVEAVRSGHGLAVPVLPLADTVKQVGGDLVTATPDRSALRVIQTPQAFRAELLDSDLATDPLAAAVTHAATGAPVHTVAGDPTAFPVRSEWDRVLAELLVERGGR